MRPTTWPVLLLLALLAGACGRNDPATFRGRNAPSWGVALILDEEHAIAFQQLAEGGVEALPVLRELVRGEHLLVALAAGELISRLGDEARDAVPDLVKVLRRKDRAGLAATALGAIGPAAKDALGPLRELFDEPDERLRMAAATACWRIGKDAAAVAMLARGVDSETPGVAQMAVSALALIGGTDVIDPLVGALKSNDAALRESAADALGSLGADARKARPTLYETLKDPDADVRKAAERALAAIRR